MRWTTIEGHTSQIVEQKYTWLNFGWGNMENRIENEGTDDQLAQTKTDNNGNFELQGGVGQMTKMNVHFKMYHDCKQNN